MSDTATQRVLVLEDEEPLRRLWIKLIERAGYDAAGAGNTTDMRALLAQAPADVLLSDVHLPGESGMTLMREVRSTYPEVAVLLVSGVGDEEIAAEAIRLGAAGYLLKPVGPKQVLLSISNALRQREVERERRSERDQLEQEIGARGEALEIARAHGRQSDERASQSVRRAQERDAIVSAVRRRAARLERLCELQRSILPQMSVAEFADALASGARALVDADIAEVWMLDPEGEADTTLLAATQGVLKTTTSGTVHMPIGEGITAQALTGESPVACGPDAGADELGDRLAQAGARFAVAVPLREAGSVAGSLVVGGRTEGHALSDEDRDLLLMLGEHASLVLTAGRASEQVGPMFRDPLTKLPGRPAFLSAVRGALDASNPTDAPPAVALIGIDAFLAAPSGSPRERLLKACAAALREECPGTAADLGLGRFAVLFADEAGRADPVGRADALRAAVSGAVGGAHVPQTSSVSLGLAYGEDGPEQLLRHAGAALVRARRAGGAQCASYHADRRATLRADASLEAHLARAVDSEAIGVRYQPIVSLAHRTLEGLRVAPRWTVDSRPVAPALFLPLAEEIGVADAIGRAVLRAACAQVAEWGGRFRAERPLGMSVRLTPFEWRRDEVVADVRAAIEESGLRPSRLTLEIDEHLLATFDETLVGKLEELSRDGVRIAVEGFGAGTVPIDYLEALPISVVRAARELIDGLGEEAESEALMRSVAQAAKGAGIELLAQGIEGPKQVVKLRGVGCDFGQGPLFSLPLEAQTVAAMFERGGRSGAATAAGLRPRR